MESENNNDNNIELPDIIDYNLYIIGRIDEEMVNDFLPDFFSLSENVLTFFPNPKNRPYITITISTMGGDIMEMFAIYDAIRKVKSTGIEVETLGLGKVMSAGLLLLAAGSKGRRRAGKNTRFMFHEVTGGFDGKSSEILKQKAEVDYSQNQYLKALSESTKKPLKFFNKIINLHTDYHFDSEEALKWNLIDYIEE